MRTTEAGLPIRSRPDPRLVRWLVLVNGAVPGIIFAYDAWRHQLGANGVNYALHTTGLLALLFFVLSLVVTPLKRITGWNELVAGRRALGLYGFFYLVVHFVVFFAFDRGGSVSSTVHEILERRYLQLGTIALILFAPLAITATDGMISRLGPRRWKRLHRLTYVATSLGAIHYILLVKKDIRQPVVFAVGLGVLLAYRVVTTIGDRRRRAKKKPWSGELAIVKTVDESPDVRTFRLAPPDGGKLAFTHRPGQYLNIALVIDGQRVNRSYTIASSPTQREHCEITVKKANLGVASGHLHGALAVGTKVKVTAPAGRFIFDGEGATRVLLVAGGVGITPLMAMIRSLTDNRWRGKIDLVYSVKTQADIVFAAELAERTKRFPDLRVTVTLTREPEGGFRGARGPISRALIEGLSLDLRSTPIFLCGPDPMMASMRALFAALERPRRKRSRRSVRLAAARTGQRERGRRRSRTDARARRRQHHRAVRGLRREHQRRSGRDAPRRGGSSRRGHPERLPRRHLRSVQDAARSRTRDDGRTRRAHGRG